MDVLRNNLADSSSPYLWQHRDNPVWWQEWSPEVFAHALEQNKPLLVSVGYSTCHWCHVMAADAFSNADCAAFLNDKFVSIKVDREQRPDIDQYLMAFLVATTGNGGWPLNAFLTPEGDPFFAMTYAGSKPRFSMPGFVDTLSRVRQFYDTRRDEIRTFDLPAVRSSTKTSDEETTDIDFALAVEQMNQAYDGDYGGFGSSQKFPPHSTLLFQLYAHAGVVDTGIRPELIRMAAGTLDAMKDRGLHDHLQGGFFRYSVDRAWTVPHFEKMLYDQALLLWSYSLASRIVDSEEYRTVASGIFTSLEETFRIGDLYAAAHDADTNHEEGATYVWSADEIEEVLEGPELEAFLAAFTITEEGNFEGKNHLTRRATSEVVDEKSRSRSLELARAAEKLLSARRRRAQPFRDDKLLTAWNSLAGCGLVAAHRFAGVSGALGRATEIAQSISTAIGPEGHVPHDMANRGSPGAFLSDHACYALLLLMLSEETTEFAPLFDRVFLSMSKFRVDGTWFESQNDDFRRVPADTFDSPIPSSTAIAETVVLVNHIRNHEEYAEQPLGNPLAHGFAGVAALLSHGYFHAIESPSPVAWTDLPPNTVQFRGENFVDCFRGVCYMNLDQVRADRKADV